MEETEGITYGYVQFNRYLEDLVGTDVSKKINDSRTMLKESLGATCCFYGGCGLIGQVPDMELVRSLFVIPMDNRKGASGICKFFSKDYDLEGKCITVESFNIKGYPLPRIGFFKRFDKELVEKMKEYDSNEKRFRKAITEKIIEIPYVVLPIEQKLIEAHFNRAVSLYWIGECEGLFNRPNQNINYLKSNAYAERANAVIVEPTISGLSGKYTLIKFQDKKS